MSSIKTKILGTGLTGLVGSRIVELLSDQYDFEDLSLETGIDITNKEQVEKRVVDSPARVILHLAAKADVDGCEKDKEKDIKKLRKTRSKMATSALQNEGIKEFIGLNSAWAVNVEGTRNILEACKKSGKKIIYISTDFVFDGAKDFYTEGDTPNPINWYGVTKYEGEKVVQNAGVPYLICRLAFPYRAKFEKKKDFVRGILEKLKKGEKIVMVKDGVITPTFIDDIAYALDSLIKNDAQGIYHVVGGTYHTPLEAAYLIAQIFSLDKSLIGKTTRETYFARRAPRPFSLALKNDKLKKLGIKMSILKEGLERVKNQLITKRVSHFPDDHLGWCAEGTPPR